MGTISSCRCRSKNILYYLLAKWHRVGNQSTINQTITARLPIHTKSLHHVATVHLVSNKILEVIFIKPLSWLLLLFQIGDITPLWWLLRSMATTGIPSGTNPKTT